MNIVDVALIVCMYYAYNMVTEGFSKTIVTLLYNFQCKY